MNSTQQCSRSRARPFLNMTTTSKVATRGVRTGMYVCPSLGTPTLMTSDPCTVHGAQTGKLCTLQMPTMLVMSFTAPTAGRTCQFTTFAADAHTSSTPTAYAHTSSTSVACTHASTSTASAHASATLTIALTTATAFNVHSSDSSRWHGQ